MSLLIPRYEQPSDVRMRLHNSFAKFEDAFVYLKHIPETLDLEVFELRNEKSRGSVSANDEKLDISSLPLGYTSAHSTSCFLSRNSLRQQRQCVSHDNTQHTVDVWAAPNTGPGIPADWSAMLEMFEQSYPNLAEAKARLRGNKYQSVPLSSKIAIVRHPNDSGLCKIRFAGQTMGFFYPSDSYAMLVPDFKDKFYTSRIRALGIECEVINET